MSLLESHEYGCLKLEIPCFVAAVSESGVTEERPQDTLYVEINAPSVRPKLIVVSNHGRTTIDFGQVCRGHQEVRTILLQNISEEFLKVRQKGNNQIAMSIIYRSFPIHFSILTARLKCGTLSALSPLARSTQCKSLSRQPA
eukprot:m.268941 g.268941  ORF g.268941 m.268941 type:complete len:142 (+) comp40533_c1_seq138:4066-4491(+)